MPFCHWPLPLPGLEKLRDHVVIYAEAIQFDLRPASVPERGYPRYGPDLNQPAFTVESPEQIVESGKAMATAGLKSA